MVTKRIIPCLDIKDGRVVKGVNFLNLQDVSNPVKLADYYSRSGADELVFYDITASFEGRKLFTDILTAVASTIFIPLTVGGGINGVEENSADAVNGVYNAQGMFMGKDINSLDKGLYIVKMNGKTVKIQK